MILFFEDEKKRNEPYADALRKSGYDVIVEAYPGAVLETFDRRFSDLQLVIIDIIAPVRPPLAPGLEVKRARNGLSTGLEVLRLMDERVDGAKIPKLVLTNRQPLEIEIELGGQPDVRGCYGKNDVLPYQLVAIVKKILGEA